MARSAFLYQLGVNPPADIASGRIAEVRSRSRSCNCMTRTSQQECRGILETVVMIESKKLNCVNYTNKINNKNNIDNSGQA